MSPCLSWRVVQPITLLGCLLLCAELFHPGPAWGGKRGRSKDDPDDVPPASAAAPATTPAVTPAEEHQRRLDSIESLKQLIASADVSEDQKAELMFRLADLYLAEGRAVAVEEEATHRAATAQSAGTEPWGDPNKAPDDSGSRAWFEKAIKLGMQISSAYPQYARSDEVSYLIGSALMESGRVDDATQQFLKLVKYYPDSRLVPDAYLQIGEYYFDKNESFKALMAYQKAIVSPAYDKHAYAVYKLAWSYYNVGEYGKAIENMIAVVADPAAAAASDLRGGLVLRDEALVALVTFFADGGELTEAEAYFGQAGQSSLLFQTLERAAFNGFQSGNYQGSIDLYTRLIRDSKNSSDIARYQQMLSAVRSKQVIEAERQKAAEAAARAKAAKKTPNGASPTPAEDAPPACDKTSCGPNGKRDENGCCLEPEL